jgi:hypothetical protein
MRLASCVLRLTSYILRQDWYVRRKTCALFCERLAEGEPMCDWLLTKLAFRCIMPKTNRARGLF